MLGCKNEGCFPIDWLGDGICDPPLECKEQESADCEFTGPAMPFNQVTFELDEDSSTISGEGILPLATGNTWIYNDADAMNMGDMNYDDDGPPACIQDCAGIDTVNTDDINR